MDRRLTGLDGLRGLAAISVVLCHFYFILAGQSTPPSPGWQPGRPFLDLFYDHGFRAVELFWMLSGFVFTYVYCFGAEVSTREFAINRFARLYPLHFVTLLVTALLELLALASFGRYLVNIRQDGYHFGLQLLMISGWGFEEGPSYNDVVWSVSVEIVAYALFWGLREQLMRWRAFGALLVAAACGVMVLLGPRTFIFACGFFFFAGVALAFASFDLRKRRGAGALLIAVLAIIGGASLASGNGILGPSLGLSGAAGALILLTVEGEALLGPRLRAAGQWLGDCSYGIYLWHLPLHLAFILMLRPFADLAVLATSSWFLLAYLAVLLTLSRASFILVERPARRCLRRFAKGRSSNQPVPAVI